MIPKTVKSIKSNAFKNCDNLTSITLQEGLEYIGENSFSETAIREIGIPTTVKIIGKNAFSNCK